jgi:hypothetical protein
MFYPDVTRGVAEARRVLKRGGRFAVVAWDEPSKSPFLTIAGGAVAQFFPGQPPNSNAPGAFRFGRPGALEEALRRGGFTDVSVESRPMSIEVGSPSEYWQMFLDHAAGVGAKVAQLSDADRAKLVATVEAGASQHIEGDRVKLTATTLCAVAQR